MGSLGQNLGEGSPYPFSSISPETHHKTQQTRPLDISVISLSAVLFGVPNINVSLTSSSVFPACVDAFCPACRPKPPRSLSLRIPTASKDLMGTERNGLDIELTSPVLSGNERTFEQSSSVDVVRTPITRLAPMRFNVNQNPSGSAFFDSDILLNT